MMVNLKRNFWDGEKKWRSTHNPHFMPDEMIDSLPADADVIEEPRATKSKVSRPRSTAD